MRGTAGEHRCQRADRDPVTGCERPQDPGLGLRERRLELGDPLCDASGGSPRLGRPAAPRARRRRHPLPALRRPPPRPGLPHRSRRQRPHPRPPRPAHRAPAARPGTRSTRHPTGPGHRMLNAPGSASSTTSTNSSCQPSSWSTSRVTAGAAPFATSQPTGSSGLVDKPVRLSSSGSPRARRASSAEILPAGSTA